MARPRKPTAALELKGAFKKDPQRKDARENEPVPNGAIGAPPERLSEDEAALWLELAGYGFWLTNADRLMLEIAVKLMVLFRGNALDGGGISKLITALSKLGFSPSDRSKVQAPGAKEPEADPFADFK
ncbi:hypothetical protein [Agrobacterium radiobacter]|uniref:hypothetical protein n=1 Tax=Agrobacterium radiobacter TaxID=362 RepID=UPI0007614A79|nr:MULTISPECIES: hypothetical protein [Agrobacterium tumefaciens complex]KAB0462403.1 terminase [Agrobacterium tumefaciens]KWT80557.1 hypothetical protein ASH09_04725 [Agrobacterium radiobacter]NIB09215.1 terminase [Agrobacterium radiobacter]OOO38965.1 hypothetical protein BS628_02890 [Agrobacterium radiobacter]